MIKVATCVLAVSCSEPDAWINALHIAALTLRLSDDVVRISVGLCLGILLCAGLTSALVVEQTLVFWVSMG